MASKLTLTLAIDDEVIPPDRYEQAMQETLDLLRANGIGPTTKIAFTLEFNSEDDAIDARNELKVTLGARPAGVDADVKFETKEGIARAKLVKVTPMDRSGWNVPDVPRSVSISAETAEKAAAALRGFGEKYNTAIEMGVGDDMTRLEPR